MKRNLSEFGFLVPLAALVCIWTAATSVMAGQVDGFVTLDGQSTDWGELDQANDRGDVKPIQVDGIDVWKTASYFGQIFQTKEELDRNYTPPEVFKDEKGRTHKRSLPPTNWSTSIAFQVVGELFSGPAESSIEIFFDVYPERDHGVPQGPWHDFRPDYRFELRGKDGRIESEGYYTWEDGKWAGEQLADTPEFAAAIGGSFFECLIPWTSLGSPLNPSESGPERAKMFMLWALRTKQGESEDYYPGLNWAQTAPVSGAYIIGNNEVFIETAVEGHSWGKIKQEKDKQNKGERP